MKKRSVISKLLLIGLVLTSNWLGLGHIAWAAAGDLDTNFGQHGVVITPFGGSDDRAKALVVQPDDKIVVVGQGGSPGYFALARYNPDGSQDTGFGHDGLVLTTFPEVPTAEARAVALQDDGKIVVAGVNGLRLALARYNSDGTLDGSFGAQGLFWVTPPAGKGLNVNALIIQRDGRIVVVGGFGYDYNEYFRSIVIARFTPYGQLDPTFGTGGVTVSAITQGGDWANAIMLQPDGKFVVACWFDAVAHPTWGLLRYTASGQLDPSFGNGGVVHTQFQGYDDAPYDLRLTAGGKIIVAGEAGNNCDSTNGFHCTNADFVLAQYNLDGQLDTNFGRDGRVVTSLGGGETQASGLALLADGKIVVGGHANGDVAVAVYNSDGSPDTDFGANGTSRISFTSGAAPQINTMGVQSTGRIIVAGNLAGSSGFLLVGFKGPAGSQGGGVPRPPTSVGGEAGSRTFPETGHTVGGLFLNYWNTHGTLAQQGYPISEQLTEVSDLDGKPYTVQYFERAVFERHPENAGTPFEVLLAQLGTYRYKQKYGTAGAPGQQASALNPHYFAETGKTLGGGFRTYWEQHGGLAQQGYPISNEFTEVSDLDGKRYTVQYFERAVFEYHPENAGTPYTVLLAQLGTYRYKQKYGR